MHGVVGQQLLRIAQQAGAVLGARGVLDLVEQVVELGRLVAPVIVGLGKVGQVKRLHMRDQREVVVLVAVGTAEPLRPFHVLRLGHDAHLGQLGHDDFAALARVRRGRQGQRQLQRGFDARFGQQLLGFFNVERIDARGVHIAKRSGHVVAADGGAVAIARTLDHGLAVNGGCDGAAHAHIVQWLSGVVDGQDGLGARATDQHLKARVGLELRHATRRDAGEQVHIARQQGGDLRSRVGDEAEGGAAQLDGACRPETIPSRQHHRGTLVPRAQLVGAGTHGLGGIGIGALGLHDDGRGLAQGEQQVGVDVFVQHHQGVFVHHLRGQVGKGALVFVGAFLAASTVVGELDRSGVEGLAVLELDALAQLEGVGLEVGRDFPALGQQGRDRAVGVDLGERFKNVVLHDLGNGRGRSCRGVQAWGFQGHGQHHRILAVLRQGTDGRGQRNGSQRASGKNGSAIQHVQRLLTKSRLGIQSTPARLWAEGCRQCAKALCTPLVAHSARYRMAY